MPAKGEKGVPLIRLERTNVKHSRNEIYSWRNGYSRVTTVPTLLLKTQHICYISYNKSDIVIVGAAAAVQTQADCLVA